MGLLGDLFGVGGDDRNREDPRADRSMFGTGRRAQNHARNSDRDGLAAFLGLARSARDQRAADQRRSGGLGLFRDPRHTRNNRREY